MADNTRSGGAGKVVDDQVRNVFVRPTVNPSFKDPDSSAADAQSEKGSGHPAPLKPPGDHINVTDLPFSSLEEEKTFFNNVVKMCPVKPPSEDPPKFVSEPSGSHPASGSGNAPINIGVPNNPPAQGPPLASTPVAAPPGPGYEAKLSYGFDPRCVMDLDELLGGNK
ncbi:hypothetical protein VDGL01_08327 [Verticillium dahliae]